MARFHTSDGRFVGWRRLPNAARALLQSINRKLFGAIPELPWIPFSAIRVLAEKLPANARVWEIGAGFSTLWLAQRCTSITSIEASRDWFERLTTLIAKRSIPNIDLRFEWEAQRMADFSEVADETLDLLVVDGGPRGECLLNGFGKVRSGGLLYLDNWDNREFWSACPDFLETHRAQIASARSFVDYVPAQLGVYEGILLEKR